MLERKLDNLAHSLHFALKPADIFVGASRRSGRRLLPFYNANIGALPDYHRSRRNRTHHSEVDGFGERGHSDHAACDNWNIQQIFEHPFGRDDRRCGTHPQWRQANSHRLLVLNRSYGYSLLQPHTTIAAARSINLNHAFETV